MILAMDNLMDMGRTCTNVLGNSIAAASIGRWEQLRRPPHPAGG
jgi:Na+/H+-dicarboxylate symporter